MVVVMVVCHTLLYCMVVVVVVCHTLFYCMVVDVVVVVYGCGCIV